MNAKVAWVYFSCVFVIAALGVSVHLFVPGGLTNQLTFLLALAVTVCLVPALAEPMKSEALVFAEANLKETAALRQEAAQLHADLQAVGQAVNLGNEAISLIIRKYQIDRLPDPK